MTSTSSGGAASVSHWRGKACPGSCSCTVLVSASSPEKRSETRRAESQREGGKKTVSISARSKLEAALPTHPAFVLLSGPFLPSILTSFFFLSSRCIYSVLSSCPSLLHAPLRISSVDPAFFASFPRGVPTPTSTT